MLVSEAFINSWFLLQRQLISGLHLAYVELQGASVRPDGLTATFPTGQSSTDELALAAELAKRTDSPITGTTASSGGEAGLLRIAYPLHLGQHANGAVVVEVEATLDRQTTILELLKWGEGWLNLALSQQVRETRCTAYKRIIDAAMMLDNYADALTLILASVPRQTGCTRLSLGRVNRKGIYLEAVSELCDLDRRGSRVKMLENAMLESWELGETVSWSKELADPHILLKHRDLSAEAELSGICSVPMMVRRSSGLVFCFEYVNGFSDKTAAQALCEESASFLTPLIEYQYKTNQPKWKQIAALMGECLREIRGAGRSRQGVAIGLGMILAGAILLSSAEHRVSATAALEGSIQQAVVAPFDGYVLEAVARAGQEVSEGDVLARLDKSEYEAEKRRLQAEELEFAEQHRQAVASLDHSQARIIEAQLDQAKARLSLINSRLDRTELRAPLSGIVISGDLSRSLGIPVLRGDLLFQIAPLDQYRIAMKISDREIADITVGQTGRVMLSALAGQSVPFRIVNVGSISLEETGGPAFRVEAELLESRQDLRPGMQGTAKVVVGSRPRWWLWTHSLTDWIKLRLWRWQL